MDFPKKRFFSGYVYMEKFIDIDPAFPATTKIYFYLSFKTFSFFFLFGCLVRFKSLIQSHTKQCFYYKNYTSLVKKAINRQISIINSFKNLKTKKQSYWTSDNDIT